MDAIISIKPKYADAILNGIKLCEYRKVCFKCSNLDRVYIYATKPIMKIVGHFTIKSILTNTPSAIWNVTKAYGGITKKEYDAYFFGRDKAYAILLDTVVKYDKPIDSKRNFKAPQNFMYLDKKQS